MSAAASGREPAAWLVATVLSAARMRVLALGLALLVVLGLQWWLPAAMQAWNDQLTSQTWSLARAGAPERRVVVVDIDEKSVQAVGPWPWSRARVAELLGKLDQQGVNLKVIDILFDGAQPQDAELAQALQSGAPSVIGQLFAMDASQQVKTGQLSGAAVDLACQPGLPIAQGFMGATPTLLGGGQAVGHINPVVDADGAVRRVPGVICYQGQAYPALVVSALAAATGATPRWAEAQGWAAPARRLQVGDFALPVDAAGQLMVSFQTPRESVLAVSAADVLAGRLPPGLLTGAWALLGSTAMGAGDAVPTPQGGAVGGIEIHAQLLMAALDERTPFVPAWATLWPWLAGVVSVLALLLVVRLPRPGPGISLPVAAGAVVLALWAGHVVGLLVFHQVLAWGAPALFTVLAAMGLLAAEAVRVRFERERLYQNLSSYLPQGAARQVALTRPTERVEAQRMDATVMVVDLRNFSAYCEGRSPEESATVLHLFYTNAERVVSQHGGVVEQMAGDGLLAVWNGSSPCADHAQRAMGAAQGLWQEVLAQLPKSASRKTPPLDVGIGIESGDVLVGSFGPAGRRVHMVMGQTVSIAMRLEGLTAELAYPILLGPEVVRRAEPEQAQRLGDFLLAGVSQTRTIYALPVQYGPEHLHLVYSVEQEQAFVG